MDQSKFKLERSWRGAAAPAVSGFLKDGVISQLIYIHLINVYTQQLVSTFFFFNNFCRFASILSFVRVCWVLNLVFENIEFNKWRVFEALTERRLQLRFHDEILTTSLFVNNSIIFMNRFLVLLQQRIWQCRVVQCVMKHWESCGMLQIHLFGTFRLSPGELVYC